MKTFIPRHIDGGMFNMSMTIGPFTISMKQMFIISLGVAMSLGTGQVLLKNGVDKIIVGILVTPMLILMIGIAFFNFSQMTLLQFIAKLVRTYFLNEPKKYQVNYSKINKYDVYITNLKAGESKQVIQVKENKINKDKFDDLNWKL